MIPGLLSVRSFPFDLCSRKGNPMSKLKKASSRLFPDSVTNPSIDKTLPFPPLRCASKFESTCFPQLDWLLDPRKKPLVRKCELQDDTPDNVRERIYSRMVLQEAKEVNRHLCTDRRIAMITVMWCIKGVPDFSFFQNQPANVAATQEVLNCFPEQVWHLIIAERRSKLADEFPDWFDADGNRKPDVPKKPVTSIPANGGICIPAGVGAEKMTCPVVAAPSVPCPKKKESA